MVINILKSVIHNESHVLLKLVVESVSLSVYAYDKPFNFVYIVNAQANNLLYCDVKTNRI